MKKTKIKSNIFIIALIITLTTSILIAFPSVIAQPPPPPPPGDRTTYSYLGAVPNPVGINQEVLLHIGITEPLGNATQGWTGLTVDVTRPDGTKETLGPFTTDSTGGTGSIYIPTMVGTYMMKTVFPEQVLDFTVFSFFGVSLFAGTTMLGSESEVLELVVQEEPVEHYPAAQLPDEYWSRPIDAQLREYSRISGSCTVRIR